MPLPNRALPPPRNPATAWSAELDRSLALTVADAFDRSAPDPLLGLLPHLYHACRLVPLGDVRRWVRRHLHVEVSEAELRAAVRWPDRHWSHLWQTALRPAGRTLCHWSRWSLAAILFEDENQGKLRDELAHLWLGDLATTHRALDEIKGAMDVLAQRWFGLDAGTRAAARRYLDPVIHAFEVDAGFTRPPRH